MQAMPFWCSNKHTTGPVAVQASQSIAMSAYSRFVIIMLLFCHGNPFFNNDLPDTPKKTRSFLILIEICTEGSEQFPGGLVALHRIFFQAG
jgi:hypothetical protein